MKRLKKHQVQNCSECKRLGTKTPAKWRNDGFWNKAYCNAHKHFVIDEGCRGERKTEAEYQIEHRYGIEL